MIRCKKCNADLSQGESRSVAQWHFCLDCFNALMNEAESRKGTVVQSTSPVDAARTKRCLVCETELGKDEGHALLGFLFCDSCYENLVKRPPIQTGPEGQPVAPARDIKEKEAVAQVRVDFVSKATCHGCGKTIRAIAGRSFEGQLYCPDCYFNLPEVKFPSAKDAASDLPAQETRETITLASSDEGQDYVCQTCQHRVFKENLLSVEGFMICSACLATDRELALSIARNRQRRLLERLKNELN